MKVLLRAWWGRGACLPPSCLALLEAEKKGLGVWPDLQEVTFEEGPGGL